MICPAKLEMFDRGKMTPRHTGNTYEQYSRPTRYDCTVQQRFLVCPAAAPNSTGRKAPITCFARVPVVVPRSPMVRTAFAKCTTSERWWSVTSSGSSPSPCRSCRRAVSKVFATSTLFPHHRPTRGPDGAPLRTLRPPDHHPHLRVEFP